MTKRDFYKINESNILHLNNIDFVLHSYLYFQCENYQNKLNNLHVEGCVIHKLNNKINQLFQKRKRILNKLIVSMYSKIGLDDIIRNELLSVCKFNHNIINLYYKKQELLYQTTKQSLHYKSKILNKLTKAI